MANKQTSKLIVKGERILLRHWYESDCDRQSYWQSHGEWRFLDAPWYGVRTETTPEQAEKDRAWFMEKLKDPDPTSFLHRRAVIAMLDDVPIGHVSWYQKDKREHELCVGISICEDEYLNRGIGTEALTLWINYLFETRPLHKISLETWSFNPRMAHVAEKVGFTLEARLREMRQWQEEWLDLLHFGLLRKEWKGLHQG